MLSFLSWRPCFQIRIERARLSGRILALHKGIDNDDTGRYHVARATSFEVVWTPIDAPTRLNSWRIAHRKRHRTLTRPIHRKRNRTLTSVEGKTQRRRKTKRVQHVDSNEVLDKSPPKTRIKIPDWSWTPDAVRKFEEDVGKEKEEEERTSERRGKRSTVKPLQYYTYEAAQIL